MEISAAAHPALAAVAHAVVAVADRDGDGGDEYALVALASAACPFVARLPAYPLLPSLVMALLGVELSCFAALR